MLHCDSSFSMGYNPTSDSGTYGAKKDPIGGRVRQAGQVSGLSRTDVEPDPYGPCSHDLGESSHPSFTLPEGSHDPVGLDPVDKWEQRLDNDKEQVARRCRVGYP
jgi:hypothetical protein